MVNEVGSGTRRRLLATAGATAAGSIAGCTDRLWSRAEHSSPGRVSMTIKTLPTDDDPMAARIASRFRDNLESVGIDTDHTPTPQSTLYRDVLLDRNYDVVVAKHPGFDEVDGLRPFLHSSYVTERGWQNPFGFADVTVDELLESQLSATGAERERTIGELFEYLLETAPFTAVVFPERLGATSTTIDTRSPPRLAVDLFDLLGTDGTEGAGEPLSIGIFGHRVTDRLNPVGVDAVDVPLVLDVLYDPLVRRVDGEELPWLASQFELVARDDGSGLDVDVRLRDGARWHDGEPLTASDVAFTYRFLADTSLGDASDEIPAPRFRGRASLVEAVTATAPDRVRLSVGDVSRGAAIRALTVPLLPEHLWGERTGAIGARRTEALEWDNREPVGSGLLAVETIAQNERIVLEPFEDHPLVWTRPSDDYAFLDGVSDHDGVDLQIWPGGGAAADAIVADAIDVVAGPMPSTTVGPIVGDAGTRLLTADSPSFYFVGYNTQHPELGNPRFRSVVSRLVDREFVARELFDGRAVPAITRSTRVGVSHDLWPETTDDGVPPFPGTNGEIDAEAVLALFDEVGYRYENGALTE